MVSIVCADLLEQKVLMLGSAEQCMTPRSSPAALGLCFGWLQRSSEVGIHLPQKDLGSVGSACQTDGCGVLLPGQITFPQSGDQAGLNRVTAPSVTPSLKAPLAIQGLLNELEVCLLVLGLVFQRGEPAVPRCSSLGGTGSVTFLRGANGRAQKPVPSGAGRKEVGDHGSVASPSGCPLMFQLVLAHQEGKVEVPDGPPSRDLPYGTSLGAAGNPSGTLFRQMPTGPCPEQSIRPCLAG